MQRRGLTTFKVVPPNKTPPCNPDPRPGSDLGQPDPEPQAENPEPGTEEDQCSPGGLESRTRSVSPELSASCPGFCDEDQNISNTTEEEEEKQQEEQEAKVTSEAVSGCSDGKSTTDQRELVQSPGADMELCGSCTDEKEPEDDDVSFPPPPPPVFFTDDLETETSTTSTPPASPPAGSTFNEPGDALRESRGNNSALFDPSQSELNPGPSRFAQAVASAVQRSRLQSSGKGSEPQASGGPHGRLPSPPRSNYQHGEFCAFRRQTLL